MVEWLLRTRGDSFTAAADLETACHSSQLQRRPQAAALANARFRRPRSRTGANPDIDLGPFRGSGQQNASFASIVPPPKRESATPVEATAEFALRPQVLLKAFQFLRRQSAFPDHDDRLTDLSSDSETFNCSRKRFNRKSGPPQNSPA
jgi:hypothetical protein